jgi:hypothetical protein
MQGTMVFRTAALALVKVAALLTPTARTFFLEIATYFATLVGLWWFATSLDSLARIFKVMLRAL